MSQLVPKPLQNLKKKNRFSFSIKARRTSNLRTRSLEDKIPENSTSISAISEPKSGDSKRRKRGKSNDHKRHRKSKNSSDDSHARFNKSMWNPFKKKVPKETKFEVSSWEEMPEEILKNLSARVLAYGETHLKTFVNMINFMTKYTVHVEGIKLKREKRWLDEAMIERAREEIIECEGVSDFFKVRRAVGSGAFGKVSLCIDRGTDEVVAVKQLNNSGSEKDILNAIIEVAILQEFDHPSLLEYRSVYMARKKIYLCTEFLEGRNLADLVRSNVLGRNEIALVSVPVLEGLVMLHKHNIIHMDIKASNIMVRNDGVVKIIDFGLSTQVDEAMYGIRGSPYYIPPEMIQAKKYDTQADIWSFGITVLEIMLKRVPNIDVPKMDAMVLAASGKISRTFPEDIEELAEDFLRCCLRRSPSQRSTAQELLSHPYLYPEKLDKKKFLEMIKMAEIMNYLL